MERVRSNEGLAYDVRSQLDAGYFFPGTFTLSLQTKSLSAAYAIGLCLEELRKICREPVTADELEKAKSSLIESFPAMFRTGQDIAVNFCWNEYWGRPFDHFDLYRPKIKALTAGDLLQAAQKHLHPDSLMIAVVGNLQDCSKGDGVHPAQLSDFGPVETADIQARVDKGQ
jgi:zinc protease